MAVKKLRPITPGQRFRIAPVFENISKDKPEKSLVRSLKSKGGRNNTGKMTVRNVGGGHKKKLREIDFKRDKFNIPATVKSIEYDPNRTARIALLYYADGEKKYILAPDGKFYHFLRMHLEFLIFSLPLTEFEIKVTEHNLFN